MQPFQVRKLGRTHLKTIFFAIKRFCIDQWLRIAGWQHALRSVARTSIRSAAKFLSLLLAKVSLIVRQSTNYIRQFLPAPSIIVRRAGVYGLVAIAIMVALRLFVDFAIGRVFKDVVPQEGSELPTTIAYYPSGPEVISIIGGKGQGLNCSIPIYAEPFFWRFRKREKFGSPNVIFRQACVFHDLCYRHGLATYGYSKNDCDELLQQHALQICKLLDQRATASHECQLDAKKVTAGVKLGGSDSYQGWESSTYFEFDRSPDRAQQFSVARAANNPLNFEHASSQSDDPRQLVFRFDISQSTDVTCLNCADRSLTQDELSFIGLPSNRPQTRLRTPRIIDLPPRFMKAAPNLILVSEDVHRFVWFRRRGVENTWFCSVTAEPKFLLAGTKMDNASCEPYANKQLSLSMFEVFGPVPLPAVVPLQPIASQVRPFHVFATTISPQARRGISVCWASTLDGSDFFNVGVGMQRNCFPLLPDQQRSSGTDIFGIFQNMPITKGHRQIYFQRNIGSSGEARGAVVRALIVGLKHEPVSAATKSRRYELSVDIHKAELELPDDFDPLMPALESPESLDFISIRSLSTFGKWWRSADTRLEISEIDLAQSAPKPIKAPVKLTGKEISLHESWAHRAPLVIKADSTNKASADVLFSRANWSTKKINDRPDNHREERLGIVDFQFLLASRRPATTDAPAQYDISRGMVCSISYRRKTYWTENDRCSRLIEWRDDARASPERLMKGGQILVGRFGKDSNLRIALLDACMPQSPVIVSLPQSDVSSEIQEQTSSVGRERLTRVTNCRSVPLTELARQMNLSASR